MSFNIYTFQEKKLPILTSWSASTILKSLNEGKRTVLLTIDLGLSWNLIECYKDYVVLEDYIIDVKVLKEIAARGEDHVYVLEKRGLIRLSKYSNGKYYKLKAISSDKSPTLEINGIHMHRIEDITPWDDACSKVESVNVRRGDIVLDVGTGLGYTSSWCLLKGASYIITIECDIEVLKMAEYNPWSRMLSSNRVRIVLGDAYDVIRSFNDEMFTVIIHDPPRFQLAGHLYSKKFYEELYRVLKRNGRLYHYTGSPKTLRGVDIARGVIKRLSTIGFDRVIRSTKVQGVIAFKY